MSLDVLAMFLIVPMILTANSWGSGVLRSSLHTVTLTALALLYALVPKSARVWLILVGILSFVFVPLVARMQVRARTVGWAYINDSALQTEIAGKFIHLGLNPYATTYENTDLANWEYLDPVGKKAVNPALYNNVHPPLLLVASTIQYKLFAPRFGWFDIRVVYTLAYLAFVLLVFRKFSDGMVRNTLLLFTVLNPLFVAAFILGTNDIVPLGFLLWSAFFAEKRKMIASGLLLGLGIATKQTVWIAAPFFYYWVYKTQNAKQFRAFSLSSLILALLFFVPFIAWDAKAFFNSLVLYVSQGHPIEGVGASIVLSERFPFWLTQLAAFVISFAWFTRQFVKKKVSTDLLLGTVAVATALVWFVSKYMLTSHLVYVGVLAASAWAWRETKT